MVPVILSGGSGTRLWPVSRESYPKQFCEFFDQSFLKNTYDRIRPLGTPYVVTLQGMKTLTQKALRGTDFDQKNLVLEPLAKNTAAAIALVATKLLRAGKTDEIIGVFPADHLITETEHFIKALKAAEESAKKGEVVTIGIPPRYAATGYGYMELQEAATRDPVEVRQVTRFFEKPDAATAEKFVRSGRHFWNAGIFVFKVSRVRALLEEYMPELWQKIQSLKADGSNLKHVYANIVGTSIDYGVMEKLEKIKCIPSDLGWSDVGSWDEIARLNEEVTGVTLNSQAQVVGISSDDNFVYSESKKLIGLCDIRRMIVVDTPDAILIVPRDSSQKVRQLVDEVRKEGLPQAEGYPSEVRPWGRFDVLTDAPDHKVKRLIVDAGQQLSYQYHDRRDEYWLIVAGEAEITLDDNKKLLRKGEQMTIRRGQRHRVANPGPAQLVIVEIQLGDYFGEDDIVRLKDDYQRV